MSRQFLDRQFLDLTFLPILVDRWFDCNFNRFSSTPVIVINSVRFFFGRILKKKEKEGLDGGHEVHREARATHSSGTRSFISAAYGSRHFYGVPPAR